MIRDIELLNAINSAMQSFGPACAKYCGAVTTEIIRKEMESNGINVSARDVFIRGMPIEIDLIIYKKGITSENNILYEPKDVLVAIEVKNTGSFGQKTIDTIRQNREYILKANRKIKYCYLTLAERKGFKWAISKANSGCESYTLFWHRVSGSNRVDESTGDWSRFLGDMQKYQR